MPATMNGLPIAAATTTTLAAASTSTPLPAVWAVVADGGTLYFDTPGDVGNIQHHALMNPDRLPAGEQERVLSRNAAGDWLEVSAAGDVWIPLSGIAGFKSGWNGPTLDEAAALAAVPVNTDVYPTMDATQQSDATMAVVEATLMAQGATPYKAESTAWAMVHPAPTLTPVPFPAITATPWANCTPDPDRAYWLDCKDKNGHPVMFNGVYSPFFASQDYLDKSVHGAYVHYLDLVMGRNGPPASDISEMLKTYMLPSPAKGQTGAPEMLDTCTYGDVAGYLSRLQSSDEYLRIRPGGRLVWGRSPSSYGADYFLSLEENRFEQPGQFVGVAVYELVDIATGRVLKTASAGRPYSFRAKMKYSTASDSWLISFDDFCGNVSSAGAWQW